MSTPLESERKTGSTAFFAVVGFLSFALFCAISVRDHFFGSGHDHWCSGHALLLARSYLHAHFSTPYGLPVENPFGPVAGNWFPYTGWPPGNSVLLAVLLGIFGESIFVARLYACLLTSVSTVLVSVISWRVSQTYFAALLGAVLFAGHFYVVKYSGFIFNDTLGLTWSLLVITVFPQAMQSSRRWAAPGLALLAGLGALISWQCCMAPVACTFAAIISCPGRIRQKLLAFLLPIVVTGLAGAALVVLSSSADAALKPNGWGRSEGLFAKLATRTGYSDYPRAMGIFLEHVKCVSLSPEFLFLLVALFVLVASMRLRSVRRSGTVSSEGDWRRFYLHSLWLFPTLWLVTFPEMHLHDFQVPYSAPFIAAGIATFLDQAWRLYEEKPAFVLRCATLAAALLLLGFNAVVVATTDRKDSLFFAAMAADVQQTTGATTPVIVVYNDRGLWWRLNRPVVGIANRKVLEEQRAEYVLVAPEDWHLPRDAQFEVLVEKPSFERSRSGYKILRRIQQTTAR